MNPRPVHRPHSRRFIWMAGLAAVCAGIAGLPIRAATHGSTDTPDGITVLQRATAAAGGEAWAKARTLMLSGRAEFWGPSGAAPRSAATSYVMWRVFDPERSASHGAEGKVRIIAKDGDKLLFTVGYDGQTTWTERGITPPAEADAFWAANFGFGIIRHALKPGFKAERVADGAIGGHTLYMVRLTDPHGGVTLFGIDQQSHALRTMGFTTPRGWHERHYDDFVRLTNPDWLQARKITLYYNGVKANVVYWDRYVINGEVDPAVFAPPADLPKLSTAQTPAQAPARPAAPASAAR
jgi:hypothetical protein